MPFVVVSTVMQTPRVDLLEVLETAVISVGDDGVIDSVEHRRSAAGAAILRAASANSTPILETPAGSVLLPGLIDLHVHAPQWPQLGVGLDLTLERWLFDYTFPLEAKYTDPTFAARVWNDLVTTLLRHGTTTAVYFATNDLEATTALASACARLGQRCFVGRVAMDHPEGSPPWYRDASASAGVAASAASIEAIRAVDTGRGLVHPIVTPRFTPACTDALLGGLGELAAATGTPIQTHCAESDWVRSYAEDRFGTTDAAALDRFGLLRDGSVLAHCNHLTDEDSRLINERHSGIAHCPLSNSYFANAVLRTRRLMARGVRIGLGSDIAGGAAPGLLRQCHEAVTVSRLLEDGVNASLSPSQRGVADSRIDTTGAFWLATVGGASVVGLPLGLLAVGNRFDAILVQTGGADGPLRFWPEVDDDARLFEKIVRLAQPSDIHTVWVNGRKVVDSRWA